MIIYTNDSYILTRVIIDVYIHNLYIHYVMLMEVSNTKQAMIMRSQQPPWDSVPKYDQVITIWQWGEWVKFSYINKPFIFSYVNEQFVFSYINKLFIFSYVNEQFIFSYINEQLIFSYINEQFIFSYVNEQFIFSCVNKHCLYLVM